jgi:Cu/Ag efflux protein CusF
VTDFFRSKCLIAIALVVIAVLPSAAQDKTLGAAATATATATIQAIDSTNRLVTLKFDDGTMNTVWAGPEVRRFDELKVGDKVTFRYQEAAVVQVKKPGEASSGPSAQAGIARSTGPKPGGAIAEQVKATVTVEAIDLEAPSITVKTDDGSHITYKVEDKKNLEGVKSGDRIEITYTRALMITVEGAK